MTDNTAWRLEAREGYRLSLTAKLERLRDLLARFEAAGDADSREQLRVAFHRIRGSAGSYDYEELGHICAGAEEQIVRDAGGDRADLTNGLHSWVEAFAAIVEKEMR